jgi:hypothetical protein
MPLAAILEICLLLPGPRAGVMLSAPVMNVWRSTQLSESQQPSNSSPQNSAAQPAADQQKSPAAAAAPCPENSRSGSNGKSDCKPAASTKAKPKKHHHKTLAPGDASATSAPTKTVVRNGGAADPTVDLSPGLSPQQASNQAESTNQLLASSDANLKKIAGRQLSASQQDTVKQIKSYMEQANAANKDGDVQRAHNLAVKANLLSADLAGH